MLANFNNISYWDNLRRSYLNKYMSEGVTEMMIFEIPSDYVYEPFYYGHRKYYYYDIGDIKFQYTTYMNYKKREPEQWEEIKEENLKDK